MAKVSAIALLLVTFASGCCCLRCWRTSNSGMGGSNSTGTSGSGSVVTTTFNNSGITINSLDITKVIEAVTCLPTEYSCKGITYGVENMYYVRLGCDTANTDGCNSTMLGASNYISCNCKSDFCNAGANVAVSAVAIALSVVAALALAR